MKLRMLNGAHSALAYLGDIDGFVVGGASLDARSFLGIVRSAARS